MKLYKETKNLRENLALNTPISPSDAIAQLSEALGKSDWEIKTLFPNLATFRGKVVFDVTKEDPNFIAIFQAEGKEGNHIQLYYAFDAETGKASDLIEKMPLHPRNRIKNILDGKQAA